MCKGFKCQRHLLYLKTLKFVLPPTRTLKFALSPNVNRWNVACVRSPTQNLHVGHGDFMFVLISFALGNQFAVEYRLNIYILFFYLNIASHT